MTNRQRADEEITEFSNTFPDTDIDSIPTSVWDEVKKGVRLASAYSNYSEEKRRESDKANLVNMQNADQSSGRISGTPKKALYTASEVAAMSAREVADNYDDILYSMKSTGFYS